MALTRLNLRRPKATWSAEDRLEQLDRIKQAMLAINRIMNQPNENLGLTPEPIRDRLKLSTGQDRGSPPTNKSDEWFEDTWHGISSTCDQCKGSGCNQCDDDKGEE